MHASPLLLLLVLLPTTPLLAQDRERPRWRIATGLAGGRFDFETDGSAADDDTDAGLFRIEFEGTSARGLGGGLRIEGIGSDDDLFAGAGFDPVEARNSSLFGHFTYRLQEHRFAMPIRAGLLLNGLTLEDQVTSAEADYVSFGPYFEIEPEVTLAGGGSTTWTLYGRLGAGAAVTVIDIDNDPNDYDSSTGFAGLEAGTRLSFGKVELSLAYVGRWQSMDESDVENGMVALGYDASFQGLFFGVGVVF